MLEAGWCCVLLATCCLVLHRAAAGGGNQPVARPPAIARLSSALLCGALLRRMHAGRQGGMGVNER